MVAVLMLFGCENPADSTDNTTGNQTNNNNQSGGTDADPQLTLEGSEYFVIQLDELSYGYLGSTGATLTDLRVDDSTKHLYFWENTVSPQDASGNNIYGLPQSWLSVSVNDVGWSGMGYFISPSAATVDMTAAAANPSEYYLHFAVKGTDTSDPIVALLSDGTTEVRIALGGDFNDDGTVYTSYMDIPKDGEWHSIEIPMTYLIELGLSYDAPFNDTNIVAFLMGGDQGTTFDVDAIFFYKK